MSIYGHILKSRIKDMGYTQQQFADKVGVPYETLKNILRGRGKYTVELLELFSKELDCSYDYLMGYTKTPRRDLQTVKNKIDLADETIERLQLLTEIDNKNKFNILRSIDALISDEELLEYVTGYLYPTDEIFMVEDLMYSELEKIPNYSRPTYDFTDAILTGILKELVLLKNKISQ